MTETSLIALLIGAPTPAEKRPEPIPRRKSEHPVPDNQPATAPAIESVESLRAPQPPPRRRTSDVQHTHQRHHLDRRAADLAAEGIAAGGADDLLSTSEVAEWLGLSAAWLEIGRGKNYGPRFVVLSTRRIRYRRADVLAWLAERTYAHTRQYRNASADKPGRARLVRRAPAPTSE